MAMFIIVILLVIVAGALAIVAQRKLEKIREFQKYLDERTQNLEKREAAAREAMRRNGATRLELDKREWALENESKKIVVSYQPTEADKEKYPSDAKLLAIVKSRLAHNLGYKILAEFPDPDVETIITGPADSPAVKKYGYTIRMIRE